MFTRILHANDGSDHAFNALKLALRIAKRDAAELHVISVEERGHMPELNGGKDAANEEKDAAATTVRFDKTLQQARALAEKDHVKLRTFWRGTQRALSSNSPAILASI